MICENYSIFKKKIKIAFPSMYFMVPPTREINHYFTLDRCVIISSTTPILGIKVLEHSYDVIHFLSNLTFCKVSFFLVLINPFV